MLLTIFEQLFSLLRMTHHKYRKQLSENCQKFTTIFRQLFSLIWTGLVSFHFPIGILGQVWYLIVLIPDLCTLTYLDDPSKAKFSLLWTGRPIQSKESKENSCREIVGNILTKFWQFYVKRIITVGVLEK